ncbi:hypothetical protein IWX49DRAFT_554052 [Phyllosticta citricarpa]
MATPSMTVPTTSGVFGKLPGEIQNLIFENLEYQSAIFLAATSSYFRYDVKVLNVVSDEEKLRCLDKLEGLEKNFLNFGCTQCWRLRPSSELFFELLTTKDGGYSVPDMGEICTECELGILPYSF